MLLFTHKNGCGGAISVTQQSCAASISLKWSVTYRIGVHTLSDSLSAATKFIRIGPLFAHKNSYGSAISVTQRSCTAAISKAESHISDSCTHYSGQLLVSPRTSVRYREYIASRLQNCNIYQSSPYSAVLMYWNRDWEIALWWLNVVVSQGPRFGSRSPVYGRQKLVYPVWPAHGVNHWHKVCLPGVWSTRQVLHAIWQKLLRQHQSYII